MIDGFFFCLKEHRRQHIERDLLFEKEHQRRDFWCFGLRIELIVVPYFLCVSRTAIHLDDCRSSSFRSWLKYACTQTSAFYHRLSIQKLLSRPIRHSFSTEKTKIVQRPLFLVGQIGASLSRITPQIVFKTVRLSKFSGKSKSVLETLLHRLVIFLIHISKAYTPQFTCNAIWCTHPNDVAQRHSSLTEAVSFQFVVQSPSTTLSF